MDMRVVPDGLISKAPMCRMYTSPIHKPRVQVLRYSTSLGESGFAPDAKVYSRATEYSFRYSYEGMETTLVTDHMNEQCEFLSI